ncbi:TOPRIM and DUF927 domain-containing protein [Dickeya dianthicola]|uniref:TOPRIM and DUF927 domain-containing protein n=1 Tax=Dickeya dianthicola TaxID=204039 RepID=UPI0003A20C6E|nr:TOPRIM and DUF927 domain-containing protein [Dickeya dianthicola]ATO32760.1 DNA primase [Dickeya dianthicola RNS04.9]MBT1431861.1 DUF927 domain-containing protein [Dickeya dianthicola]MCA7004792.1 DUF927 domain-containing protein [Dickeya dianthicola]MCI4154301.1 DUF927 domain-containing protein [Dickeya dianthicola]MCI4184943.1 DUF927 domain-containing protein [Dickeya dianthicola]
MRNIDLIRDTASAAQGRWRAVLAQLGITVPDNARQHAPCPACGGKDRFRFDDDGRGAHFCNQCGAGDGLELVQKVRQCDITAAARLVAEVVGTLPASSVAAPADTPAAKRQRFLQRYQALTRQAVPGVSAYLAGKGLAATYPLLPDGRLLLALQTAEGTITAAQTLAPDGKKRLLTDSAKTGAYHPVTAPAHPDTVILAEGLATALSVSQMNPTAMTVAAIDAGNLLPVARALRTRFPAARLIVAADNDTAPGKANTGKQWAEKAAREVNGWVALPPTDEKADWDDYRQQAGIEAATRAFQASLYQPTDDTSPARREPLAPFVDSRATGVYWVTPKADRDSGDIIQHEQWLCSPLAVVGVGRDDAEQYLILRWQPAGATQAVTAALPLADVGEREGWRTLKAGGVTVTTRPYLRAILADWLQRQHSGEVWHIAHSTGWQCGAYLMPDGEVIGTPSRPVLFRGRSATASGYGISGTAESWRESVARLASGNPSMMTAIAAALAAPLIGLSGSDGFGLHFYEQSSAGKTTTANVATSLYGDPQALKLTWYGTALGIANEAEAHNDGLLPLDEVGQGSDARSVSTSAYTLFNGVGKLQGAREGGNRELKRWRTVAISTGEMDMETFLASAGIPPKAGQLVRLLNLPLEKAQQFHGYPDGKAHADALKAAYRTHYGAAGRAWIRYLAEHREDAIQAVSEAETRWRSLIPTDYGEQVHRVAERFAILEAALLVGRAVTGWEPQACRDAIQHSFNAWIKEFGTGNKEHQQITAQAEAFLNTYGLSRYAPVGYDPRDLPIRELAGYRDKGKHDDEPMVFYTFPATFEAEIARGFNVRHFARVLAQSGMLKPGADGKHTRKSIRVDGRQPRFYVLMYLPEEAEATG